jgi:hypothetical protein
MISTPKQAQVGATNVRFGSITDILRVSTDVRFTPESGLQSSSWDVRFVPKADIPEIAQYI